ncbi:MAG TPA: O-antigen ligase family protein [Patescibacteria group bacterium]|nr:O-antigen ligase family protein [Patescibacteria group bacterium]
MQQTRKVPLWGALALLIYMPLHVFLAQSLSLLTGGLSAWKIAKDLLAAAVTLFAVCLVMRNRKGSKLLNITLVLTAIYIALHFILWAFYPTIYRPSAELGIIYNNRLLAYVVLGLCAGLLLDNRDKLRPETLLKVLLGISTLVAALGVVQYFLPHDILTHVGYSVQRGTVPAFYIDSNTEFPRVMSTLRDPNSLGAYLILPLTALTALMLKAWTNKRRLSQLVGLSAIHWAALFLTFARSAWLAALLSVGLVVFWQYRAVIARTTKRYWPVLVVALAIIGVGAFAFRNSFIAKSVVTHSTGVPKAAHDSNGFHLAFAERGLEGIVRNPFGHGPGTAGLASIQNPHGSFLTENYYIQIGYEVGVLGLLVFIAINVVLYRALWQRRELVMAQVLLASFWGYVVCNMLLQMWSNEAVAAQWWITTGLVLAALRTPGNPKSKKRLVAAR